MRPYRALGEKNKTESRFYGRVPLIIENSAPEAGFISAATVEPEDPSPPLAG
jgi:hypothetical protein